MYRYKVFAVGIPIVFLNVKSNYKYYMIFV